MRSAAGGVEWQCLEVRRYGDPPSPRLRRAGTAAYEQYLPQGMLCMWGVRGACPVFIGMDAPICRWHDADNDGTFEADANEVHYYTNGANFNVTALLDANSGDVVERYLYDPYGRRTVLNGATDPDTGATEWSPDGDNRSDTDNPLGHQGLPHNPETGFLDNRLRPRTPALGRWSVRDYWAGYVDGMSVLVYEASNPLRSVDPYGLSSGETSIVLRRTRDMGETQVAILTHHHDFLLPRMVWYVGGTQQTGNWVKGSAGVASLPFARLWAQSTGADHSPAGWEGFLKGHDRSQPCGPDVTSRLEATIRDVEHYWSNSGLTQQQKCDLCEEVFRYRPNAVRAWDVYDLYLMSKKGTREHWRSVSVNGRCYDAGAVNYVLYGVIGRLCKETKLVKNWSDIWSRVSLWKSVAYSKGPDIEVKDWTYVGFLGWPRGGSMPRSTTYYEVRRKDGKKTPETSVSFVWVWKPHHPH